MWNSSRIIFVFGFITGTIISVFLQKKTLLESNVENDNNILKSKYPRKYLSFDKLRYGNHSYVTEAEFLFKTINILCLILVTKNKNLQSIKNTWGTRCNSIEEIYINKTRNIFPSKTNSNTGVWIQLCEKIMKFPSDYNWLLVVNDDTFAIMENLRYYLMNKDSSKMFYLGHSVQLWNTQYNLGKAGYVLSRGVINAFKNSSCEDGLSFRNKEDFLLGNHLKKMNISILETKDNFGFSLFHPFNLNRLLFPVGNKEFQSVYETKCCSRFTITFNAMESDKMYTYYYMLYTLQIFNDGYLGNRPPNKASDDSLVWKKFLTDHNLPHYITNEEYYNVWDKMIDSTDVFGKNMRREDYSDVN